MRQARLADGRVLKFPDGTSNEVIQRTVKRVLGGEVGGQAASQPAQEPVQQPAGVPAREQQPITPAPPLAGMGAGGSDVQAADQPAFFADREAARVPPPSGADRAGNFGFGANEGIAAAAGLPVDAMNNAPRLINLLPGEQGVGPITDNPVGGRESILRAMEGLNVRGNEPTDSVGRAVARVGQEVGAASVPAGGLMARARSAAPVAKGIGKELDTFLVEPFRQAPARTLATEGAVATGAGTGAAVTSAANPDSPTTDLLGALIGSFGTGGLMRVGSLIGDTFRTLFNPGGTATKAIRGEVGRQLVDNATSPDSLVSNVNRGLDAQDAVPGMQLTTGAASADPGLQALEFSRRNAKNAGNFRQRDTTNNTAANAALDEVAPVAANDAATRAALDARSARATGAAEAATQSKQQGLDQALAKTEPQSTQQAAGQRVRGAIEGQRESLVKRRAAQADPAKEVALASEAEVDTKKVFELIDAKLAVDKREPVVNALKNVRAKLHTNTPDADGNLVVDKSVSGLYETRKAVNDLIAGRGTDSTGRFAVKELTEVRKALDKAIIDAEPEFGQYLTDFREGSIPINALDEGATGAVLKADKLTGTPAIPSSEVPGQFFKAGKGSPEAIQEFVAKVGSRPQAVIGLRDFAMVDARKVYESQGEKGLRSWITKHEESLKAFPELRRDLGTTADLKASLDRATRREKLLKDGLSNPRKSTIALYLDAEDARSSIESVLATKNPAAEMENLTRLIRGDKDAVEGVKRGFWDNLVSRDPSKKLGAAQSVTEDLSGVPFLNPGKLKQYMRKHNAALEVLYKDDPAQLKRIRQIADAVSQGQQVGKARPPGQSGTALAQRNVNVPGLTVAGFASRSFAIARGVVSPEFVIAETTLRAGKRAIARIKKDQFEDLLDRALLDPEVAKTLVMEVNDSNANVIGRRMRLHLSSEASNLITKDDNE